MLHIVIRFELDIPLVLDGAFIVSFYQLPILLMNSLVVMLPFQYY